MQLEDTQKELLPWLNDKKFLLWYEETEVVQTTEQRIDFDEVQRMDEDDDEV